MRLTLIYPKGRTVKETHSKMHMWISLSKNNLRLVKFREYSIIFCPTMDKGKLQPTRKTETGISAIGNWFPKQAIKVIRYLLVPKDLYR